MGKSEFLRVLVEDSDRMTLPEYTRIIRNLPTYVGDNGWMFGNEYPDYLVRFQLDPSKQCCDTVTPLSVLARKARNRDKVAELVRVIREKYNEGGDQVAQLLKWTTRIAVCRSDWETLDNLVRWFPEPELKKMILDVIESKDASKESKESKDASKESKEAKISVQLAIFAVMIWVVMLFVWTYWVTAYITHVGGKWDWTTILLMVASVGVLAVMYITITVSLQSRDWFWAVMILSVASVAGAVIAGWKDVVEIYRKK
jgi:hypothetical protein